MKNLFLSIISAAVFALPLSSQATPVSWGSVSNITTASDIISIGLTSVAGANFGIATGTTTIVNNGSVDIEFKSLRSGQSATLSNGITVAASSDWINFGFNAGISSLGGALETILDTNLGVEPPDSTATATITLSGLNVGTQYQIQFFADSTGNNTQTLDGGNSLNSLSGRFVTGTFTADATSQVLSVAIASGGFAVANALTIGTVSGGGPDITPPDWAVTWPQADAPSPTSLTLRAKTNETGNAYYVVLPDGASAPTSAQVKAGTDSTNTPVAANGSMALAANTEATALVGGLSPGTAYDVYFVAEDAVPNLQASPSMVSVSLSNPGLITWSLVQSITGAGDILSTGMTSLAGADFGAPSGSTTTVNNGAVDVEFKTLNSGQSALLANGITVTAENTWGNFGTASGNSNIVGNFGIVLDRSIGIEGGSPPDADITLSGLTPGTQYRIQFFTSDLRVAANALTQTIEGATGAVSGTMTPDNGTNGTFVIGTFTAAATSQTLTVRSTGQANVALASALTIGELGATVIPPVANNDTITVNPGGSAGLTVLLNDSGGTLDPLSILVTSGPSPGSTAVPQPDGRILYTHSGGAGTTDSFTYTVRNQAGATSNEATVSITIDPSLRLENTTSNLPDTAPPVTLAVVDAFPGLLFEDVLALRSPPGSTTQLFLAERRGKISYIPDVTSATPERRVLIDLGTIPGFAFDNTTEGELGLLSFAFHPEFASNGYFYAFYTATGGNPYFNRLARFQIALDGGGAPILENPTASIATELRLFSEFDQVDNHNAGDIHFGPDGYLYVVMGDEGNQKNASRNAQLIDKDLYSAILRIDVDKKPGNIEPNLDDAIPTDGGIARFSIPIDNPFVHTSFGGTWDGNFNGSAVPDLSKVQRSFWAVGFRSPWRMSFDSLTGDLYVGDVGQENYEEVSVVERGKNYGWAFREGFQQTPGTPSANIGVPPLGFLPADPLYDYPHGSGNFQGNSVTGGVVYHGANIPSLSGKYIFGDFVSGHVWSLERGAGAPVVQRLATDSGIAAFGIDPSNGDVLLCDYLENKVKRLVAGLPLDGHFPQTLTETGIFADLATLTPNPGILAYEPAVSFWSDHAIKKRWFSIPDLAGKIGFSTDAPWTFPQGMFWVKHFDMEMVRGNPASTKRIETRVLIKTATAAYGVSYKWNDAGTEATLVEDAGDTFNLAILDDGTPINQTYQIPSRGACFSCHTPVAGHALSFNTRQLNHDSLIAGVLGNQIGTLGSAGYFDAPLPSLASTPTFAPLSDAGVSREFRVRSYLAVNCVSCHQPGASAPGTWDARPTAPLEQTGLILGSASRPLNPGDLLVVPGDPTHSILLQRVKAGNGYTRMPPLGSHVLDSGAIQLIQDWIELDLPGYQTYDQWAAGWFGPGAGPIADRGTDADGDGRDNEFERLTGTNPRHGGDYWTMNLTISGGNVLLDFPTPANAAILIESSPDLLHWTPWPVPGNKPFFPVSPGIRQLAAPLSETGPSHFFRGTAIEP